MVCAGTCAEYDWQYGYCSERITPLNPVSLYGVAKHSLNLLAEEMFKGSGITTAWGRIFYLYGPHEHPSRLVPSVVNALLQGREAPCSSGDQIRDYLFVQDVADAFAGLTDSGVTGPVNIGSGKPVAVKDIVGRIGEITGRPDLIRYGQIPVPSSDPPLIVADNRRLVREVGWTQNYTLEEGLETTISWLKQRSV